MISPITTATAAYQTNAAQTNPVPRPTAPSQPHDSVHLSAAALAQSGDVDHDGDSH